jgi:hypothetical protein
MINPVKPQPVAVPVIKYGLPIEERRQLGGSYERTIETYASESGNTKEAKKDEH